MSKVAYDLGKKRRVSSGVFITLEGLDYSGKTTAVKMLSDMLVKDRVDVLTTREPGGTRLANQLREIVKHYSDPTENMCLITELMLMSAARAQLVQHIIKPHLEKGGVVICDRYVHSTVAYQQYGRGIDQTIVQNMIEYAVDGIYPDLTLILDSSAEVEEKRRCTRADDKPCRFETEVVEFRERVRTGYNSFGYIQQPLLAATLVHVPADGTPEEVHHHICCILRRYVPTIMRLKVGS